MGPVVFDDWNALYTQLQAMRAAAPDGGCYEILFNDTFGACVVPVGTWDMTTVVWQGFDGISDGFASITMVTLDTDCELIGLREVRRIRLEALGPPPIADMVSGDLFVLDDHASLQGGTPIISFPNVDEEKTVYIDLRNGSQVLQSGGVMIQFDNDESFLLEITVDKTSVFEANTLGDGSGDGSQTARIQLAGSPEDHPAIQSFFTGQTVIVYNASGYDHEFDQSPLFLDPNKVYLYTTGNPTAVNLQPASWNGGGWVIVKNTTASLAAITITPSLGDTIDGAANYVINTAFGAVTLFSDGINTWHVIGRVV